MPSNPISTRRELHETPLFREPWQAKVFALQVALLERNVFTAREWADALGAEIRAAQAGGDPDLGDTYWHHWARALESLVAQRGLTSGVVVDARAGALAAESPVTADHPPKTR